MEFEELEVTINELIRDYWHTVVAIFFTIAAYFELKFAVKRINERLNEGGLRMTALEANHDKLLEVIYREQKNQSNEIATVLSLVQDVRASTKETEGYLRAQKEFNQLQAQNSHRRD